MSLGEYLSDRLGRLVLWLAGTVLSVLFLLASGTQRDAALLLAAVWTLVLGAVEAAAFLRRRARLEELEAVLQGLDRKYLFTECVPPPQSAYERRLFDLLRRAGRSMVETVSQTQAAQREYREYVERWVHEIKTPITAAGLICQNAEPALRRKLAGELAQIEAHAERALYYARAESPEKDLLVRRTSLEELVDRAVGRHRVLLSQCGVRVETEGLDGTVYTDEKWASFLLGQLLQNAARYRRESPVIRIDARERGRRVWLRVRDNGQGIPAHELPRVFDRGFTGSNGRGRAGGSTGMGLYLCRRLAACLEMEVRIASEEGRGTEVTLVFPAPVEDSYDTGDGETVPAGIETVGFPGPVRHPAGRGDHVRL